MSNAAISKESFAVLMERAGLVNLDEAHAADLHDAYKYVQMMAARVRTPRDRGAEPALIFALPTPDAE